MDNRRTTCGQPTHDLLWVSSVHRHGAKRYNMRMATFGLEPWRGTGTAGGRGRLLRAAVGGWARRRERGRDGVRAAVSAATRGATVRVAAGSEHDLSDISAAGRGREIEMRIPLRLLGRPRTLFVAVESRFQGITIDQTMWRVLDLNGAFGMEPNAPG